MPDLELTDITFDCQDPERVAAFWSELLGQPIAGRKGPYVWLRRPERGPGFGFQRVNESKTAKNRVHIDVAAADIADTRRRIEALGGRRAEGYESGGFLVMADPEGNEFCVVPVKPFEFDEQGRTNYLDGLRHAEQEPSP